MLTQEQRAAILELHRQGLGSRPIAKALKISRNSVKAVIRQDSSQVPAVLREEKAGPFRDEILRLYPLCKENLQRVHEELLAMGAEVSYPALTAFCRRHRIGVKEKKPSGEYHF